MENLSQKEIDYSIAKERVHSMKRFYVGVAIFILVFSVYNVERFFRTGELTFLEFHRFGGIFWIWGIILVVKGVKLFFLNQDWERKMMDKELNQNGHGKL
ncbi:2TM domain-containing protein [Halpernia sp.]|uniref:2TM domain-containing protein n=1 Tax=Halpernia sp. TaxID=2782209 RepID=UPI003A92B790